jgi:hypothetical protein
MWEPPILSLSVQRICTVVDCNKVTCPATAPCSTQQQLQLQVTFKNHSARVNFCILIHRVKFKRSQKFKWRSSIIHILPWPLGLSSVYCNYDLVLLSFFSHFLIFFWKLNVASPNFGIQTPPSNDSMRTDRPWGWPKYHSFLPMLSSFHYLNYYVKPKCDRPKTVTVWTWRLWLSLSRISTMKPTTNWPRRECSDSCYIET